MKKPSRVERFKVHFSGLSIRARFLLSLGALFLLLVAFGIHGSSTGVTAAWWAPEKPYTGYLFNPPHNTSKVDPEGRREILMANAREIRWDELLISTQFSLSQLSHNPRFPVVNTNIGNGQNMLTLPHMPVWHIVTLARPATWGYFILGAQRGLAWYWWFRVFSCFTVLYLLLEVILRSHPRAGRLWRFLVLCFSIHSVLVALACPGCILCRVRLPLCLSSSCIRKEVYSTHLCNSCWIEYPWIYYVIVPSLAGPAGIRFQSIPRNRTLSNEILLAPITARLNRTIDHRRGAFLISWNRSVLKGSSERISRKRKAEGNRTFSLFSFRISTAVIDRRRY